MHVTRANGMSGYIRCYTAVLQKIQSKYRDCERRQKMDQSVLDTIDPRVLGDDLQKARKRRGLTLEDAAKIIEAARTTLVATEKGERRSKPGELIKLANADGRQVGDFVRPHPVIDAFPRPQFRGPAAQ